MSRALAGLGLVLATGCGDGETSADAGGDAGVRPDAGDQLNVPARYEFQSRFGEGSSVAYTGQVTRQVLIEELKTRIGGLTARIDQGTLTPAAGDVLAELLFYVDFDVATGGDVEIRLATTPDKLHGTFGELNPRGARLRDKIAGNDPVDQHKDWTMGMDGWDDPTLSPEGFLIWMLEQIDAAAVARANGTIPTDPAGAPIAQVYVTADGLDLLQLVQKFLGGAINFSQGADDYLDNDLPGRGILSPNTRDGESLYTVLEHFWDEGFGYFGAARDYGDYSIAEIAGKGGDDARRRGHFDTSGDGRIDLRSEYIFGHASNAAKRDYDSDPATKFRDDAWQGFLRGRAIITAAGESLTEAEMSALVVERDRAVLAWEQAIAASAIHYINDVLQHMGRFGGEGYRFADHAKHWSEMKGFAMSLQFNRFSPLTKEQFRQVHQHIGVRPVLPGQDGVDAYRTALRQARSILGQAYGFDAANLGDDNGMGGW